MIVCACFIVRRIAIDESLSSVMKAGNDSNGKSQSGTEYLLILTLVASVETGGGSSHSKGRSRFNCPLLE